MIALSTFQALAGTVVFGSLLLALVWVMVRVAMWALPHDPPPLVDGESIHSRLVKLPPPVRHRV